MVEATEEAHPLMLMHTSMCETIPLPSDDALDPGSFADATSMASPLSSLASANAAAGASVSPLTSSQVDFPGVGGGVPPPPPPIERDALSTSLSKLSLATPLKGAYQSVTSSKQQVRRFLTLNATRPQHAARTR